MEPFGPFTPGRLLSDSEDGVLVYEAQREGDRRGKYAVKLVSPERLAAEPGGAVVSEHDPSFHDPGAAYLKRVERQKQAAATSEYFAPVLAAGHDARGVWYVTRLYTSSVQDKLRRFTALKAPDLFQVVRSVVRAARHLQTTQGCSHGNLKPSNIFIGGEGASRGSQVAVADPLPAEPEQARQLELADLRSIGELIYQLATRRGVDFDRVATPREAPAEWNVLFGKHAAGWLELCNRLLAPDLGRAGLTLERLEGELQALKPKPPLPVMPIAVAAGVLLVAGVVWWVATPPSQADNLVITVAPPGATLTLSPVDGNGQWIGTNSLRNTVSRSGFTRKLAPGKYKAWVDFGDLDRLIVRFDLQKGVVLVTNLALVYGGLNLASQPPGAEVVVGTNGPFLTPTNLWLRPGPAHVRFNLNGFETTNRSVTIPTNGQVAEVAVAMSKPPPGNGLVAFTSDPPGASVYVDGATTAYVTEPPPSPPAAKSLLVGGHRVQASFPLLEPVSTNITIALIEGKTNQALVVPLVFRYGRLQVTNTRPAVQVFLGGELQGTSPTNFLLRPGRYQLELRASGYHTNSQWVDVVDHVPTRPATTMEPLGGVVQLATDPDGATIEIRDPTGALVRSLTANGPAFAGLQPTNYDLTAAYLDLAPVKRQITIRSGTTNVLGTLAFDYGAVVFTNVTPATASIRRLGQPGSPPVKLGQRVFLPPDTEVQYRIEAAGFDAATQSVSVARGKRRELGVVLDLTTVPLTLSTVPPGAAILVGGTNELAPANGVYRLPPGTYTLVARYGRLDPVTNAQVEVKLGAPSVIPFAFSYGRLLLTNLQREGIANLAELVDGRTNPVSPTAAGLSYEKPGLHTYLLQSGFSAEPVTTNILAGQDNWLVSTNQHRGVMNSIGMALVRIPDVLGEGKEAWVGKFEVTQEQYQRVMGNDPSESPKGTNYPVEHVTWQQATDFCAKLTDLSNGQAGLAAGVPKGQYRLPTLAEWKRFAGKPSGDTNYAVISAAEPVPVGSRLPNESGLHDVIGNVWEWLKDGKEADTRYIIGAGYDTTPYGFSGPATINGRPDDEPPGYADKKIGFRVLLAPTRETAAR